MIPGLEDDDSVDVEEESMSKPKGKIKEKAAKPPKPRTSRKKSHKVVIEDDVNNSTEVKDSQGIPAAASEGAADAGSTTDFGVETDGDVSMMGLTSDHVSDFSAPPATGEVVAFVSLLLSH